GDDLVHTGGGYREGVDAGHLAVAEVLLLNGQALVIFDADFGIEPALAGHLETIRVAGLGLEGIRLEVLAHAILRIGVGQLVVDDGRFAGDDVELSLAGDRARLFAGGQVEAAGNARLERAGDDLERAGDRRAEGVDARH